ncbi:MAG: hypothetical protein IKC09_10120 [Oscillospiraceae bacterium]|nr:hypothetical protein [Oscillospiraceae bacterium]
MLFYEHGHTDPIDIQQETQLQEERDHCKEVMFEYNNTHLREDARRQAIMKGILGSSGEQFFFEPPVHISYGNHVHIGENFYSNFNLVLVDDGEIFIGDSAVIGAGSIVTRDIPENTVAVGNPCRVMREISNRDKEYYFRDLKVDYPYTLRQE